MHITIEKTGNFTFNIGCLERVDKPYYFEIVPNNNGITNCRAKFYQDLVTYTGKNRIFENLSIQIKQLPYVPGYVDIVISEEKINSQDDCYFMSTFFESSQEAHFGFVEFINELTNTIKKEILHIDNNIKELKSVAEELSKNS